MDKKYKLYRLKRYLYHVYGEIEGKKRYKSLSVSSSLKVLIFKYGEEIGRELYNKKIENDKIKGTLQGYINRYGEINGPLKYKEKNSKLSVGYNSLKNKGLNDEEILEIKSKHSDKSKQTKENFIKRDGNILGLEKFNNYVNIKKTQTLKNCKEYWIAKGFSEEESILKISSYQIKNLEYYQNLYGNDNGRIKYISIQKSKGRTREQLIEQFGIEKTNEIFEKRFNFNDFSSKSQLLFSKHLYENLDIEFKEIFIGAPINNSFIIVLNNNDKNILNQKIIVPDIKIGKFIIEYDGDFWHKDIEKDNNKDLIYRNKGFIVIRIKESDYKKNKKRIIEDILLKIKELI